MRVGRTHEQVGAPLDGSGLVDHRRFMHTVVHARRRVVPRSPYADEDAGLILADLGMRPPDGDVASVAKLNAHARHIY